MANRYFGECWKCKKEIVAFQSGRNRCNDSVCADNGGNGWCRFPARSPIVQLCPRCGQTPNGQGGEYPCPACGVPTVHDVLPHSEQRLTPLAPDLGWVCGKCKTVNDEERSLCGFCDTPRLSG